MSSVKRVAVRNIRLCTKDCLCLYVCPAGATDTENSIIDVNKCIGCGVCADACPSGAISMVPVELPPQQKKTQAVVDALRVLAQSKLRQENMANQAAQTGAALDTRLAAALEKSNRLMAEDLLREAGYMLPQSANARALLKKLQSAAMGEDFPKETVEKLLQALPCNEPEGEPVEKWRCPVCGYIHEGPLPADFVCPVCNMPGSAFERIQ